MGNGVLHVRLAALACHDEIFHAHQTAEFIGQADPLGFGGHEDVHFRQALHEFGGDGLDQFGVRKNDKTGQGEMIPHLDERQFSFQPHDFKVKILHHILRLRIAHEIDVR